MGTARGIENRLVPAAGYPLQLVRVGALKNVSLTTRLKTAFDLPRAVWDAGRTLNDYAPDVVIGVGGYASGPAMLCAVVRRIPTLAFEPNVVPGFANRVVAKLVSGAAVHFEETAKYFPHAEVTGVPVRQAFFEIPPKRGGTPTVLVFGGSQGAQSINRAVIEALDNLADWKNRLKFVHQTGERQLDEVKRAYSAKSFDADVRTFFNNFHEQYAAADLIVSRSGATTVAEIKAAGRAAILIPFPFAADDHQAKNARAMSEEKAAILISNSDLNGKRLADAIRELIGDPKRLAEIETNARRVAILDAETRIVDLVERAARV